MGLYIAMAAAKRGVTHRRETKETKYQVCLKGNTTWIRLRKIATVYGSKYQNWQASVKVGYAFIQLC